MRPEQPETVLIIAAHPDDEILGCGGTTAVLAAGGTAVDVAIMCGSRQVGGRAVAQDEAARAAADALGARMLVMDELPEGAFDGVGEADIAGRIDGILHKLQPEVVYLPEVGAGGDHARLHRAALRVCVPRAGTALRAVLAYPVACTPPAAALRPTRFVDISAQLERKVAALQCYRGRVRDFPDPRSGEAIRAAAMHWGSRIGCAAAEPFETLWQRG